MAFEVTPLVSGGYLVEGNDSKGTSGSTVLKSSKWDMVKYLRTHDLATAEFNQMVSEFFAPLTEAAAQAKARIAGPTKDWGTVIIGERVEGKEPRTVELDEHGVLLRLLDEEQTDQLRWVNGDLVATV
jgi:hypothetical protein